MPKSKRTALVTGDNAAVSSPRSVADRLYRAASECIRQRQRYSGLVEAATSEEEQKTALAVAKLCDEILMKSIVEFERGVGGSENKDEDWYRKSTALWAAARDYERRHTECDDKTRKLGIHSREQLGQLAADYDLEASALLALQHAAASYRKAVPDAHLQSQRESRVA
ncbi:MAG: hypothetical protein ACT4OZ_00005 [Gemmatimonadota bacterium]